MDHKEQLHNMLMDIINGKEEQASVTLHDYFVAKTREVTGLGATDVEPEITDETVDPLQGDSTVEEETAE